MTEYRPCPSHPGYSCSRDGVVRREAFEYQAKNGVRVKPAAVLKHVGRHCAYVTLSGKFVKWVDMIRDAWGVVDDGRPESSYADGRVITLDEYRAELRD